MDTLDAMKTVVAVVEAGSFTAASDRLNISKALVSKYISEIEKSLDVRLFNRTTRKISLTESGSSYYNHALQVIERYEYMIDEVVGEQSGPKGLLRVSAPVTFGENWLAKYLPEFCHSFPDVKLDLVLNNHAVDMLEEGIDVRIKVGKVEDSTMIARHISDVARVICASPAYLDKFGTPNSLSELQQHHCIVDTNFKAGKTWASINPNGEKESVEIQSQLSGNSPQAIVNMALAGGGIAYVTLHAAIKAIDSGKLIEILPEYQSENLGLYVLYPHRQYLPKKVRYFVKFMQQKFKGKCLREI